jgi:hypothetical protein
MSEHAEQWKSLEDWQGDIVLQDLFNPAGWDGDPTSQKALDALFWLDRNSGSARRNSAAVFEFGDPGKNLGKVSLCFSVYGRPFVSFDLSETRVPKNLQTFHEMEPETTTGFFDEGPDGNSYRFLALAGFLAIPLAKEVIRLRKAEVEAKAKNKAESAR